MTALATLQKLMTINLYNSIKNSLKTALNEMEQCALTMDGRISSVNVRIPKILAFHNDA